MEWLFSLIGLAIALLIAYVCYRIAEGKGRRGVLWGVLGFFFPLIVLIVVLLVPSKVPSAV